MTNRFRLPSLFGILAASCLTVLAGCDALPDYRTDGPATAFRFDEAIIQSVRATPIAGKDGDILYILKVKVANDPDQLRLPSAISIMDRKKDAQTSLIYDDGKGYDLVRGDGVFTGIIQESCLPEMDLSGAVASKDFEFSCKFDVVAPGEECGGYGECPERVHRSLLWGLIEYDVDLLFCFCLVECTITK